MMEQDGEDISTIFNGAMQDSVMYGVGLIRITNSPKGIIVGRIKPEEYEQLRDYLNIAMESLPVFTKP
jgi:hypothetical protein